MLHNSCLVVHSRILSEKSLALQESSNSYTFFVDVNATKYDIKNFFSKFFDKVPISVRVMLLERKKKVFRGKPGIGIRRKKAIVRFKESIDFENLAKVV